MVINIITCKFYTEGHDLIDCEFDIMRKIIFLDFVLYEVCRYK